MREAKSFCRICHAGCGVHLTLDDEGRLTSIRGDKDSALSRGYACYKAMQAVAAHNGPERLLGALRREGPEILAPIPSEKAIEEIAGRLAAIRERHGPKAVALYAGGGASFSAATRGMLPAFMEAIGSDMIFTPATIDQPNKIVSKERLGAWPPGAHDLEHSEVILLLGTNPLVSHEGFGVLLADAPRVLKAAKARGLKLICIDPRRTETARHADLHLQPIPGQDAAILAGLLREVLSSGWEDKAFCARYVGAEQMARLRAAVDAFTPALVARRAGLAPEQIVQAAALFARDHSSGSASMTTGGSFAPYADLAQHLMDVLNVVCGRLKRPGDRIAVDMLAPPGPIRAEVTAPTRSWESAPPSRIRGAGTFYGQKLTATLAEEILEPGDGQVRCLLVVGGNPATIVPDQPLITRALRSLELLVTVDPWLTATARLSHYVLAPKMMFERPDLSFSAPGWDLLTKTFAQYTPAIARPPPGADLVDDWYVLWRIAARLGLTIRYLGAPLDMSHPPESEELLRLRAARGRVGLEALRPHPSGREFDHSDGVVAEAREGCDGAFDVMPADVAEELADFLGQRDEPGRHLDDGRQFRFLLTSRRSRFLYNSTLNQLAEARSRVPFNPVYVNPADMADLGIAANDLVEVASAYGAVLARTEPDEDMRAGVVAMLHGTARDETGANVNRLIEVGRKVGRITAMPRMSAIPVDIRRIGSAGQDYVGQVQVADARTEL